MKNLRLLAITLMLALPSSAHAACFVDYKAKQDDPLKLHYGVMKVSDQACTTISNPKSIVSKRLKQNGWTLLNVMNSFDESQLDRRRGNAGQFFLRY